MALEVQRGRERQGYRTNTDSGQGLNGVLLVDKPFGPTSHDVVAMLRRLLGQRRIGHAGTLDPAATGLLPVLLGEATKLSPYLLGLDKTYAGMMRLGVETDTCDSQGMVISEVPVEVSPGQVEEVLQKLVGRQLQRPPAFSAIKVNGVALHRLARKGEEVEPEPREVEVFSLKVAGIDLTPGAETVSFETRVSSGTYVRSMARDAGLLLGCGAHLASLRRLAVGPFDVGGAVLLDELRERKEDAPLLAQERLIPPARALSHLPLLEVNPAGAKRMRQGVAPQAALNISPGLRGVFAVIEPAGDDLVAVIEAVGPGRVRTLRVFHPIS